MSEDDGDVPSNPLFRASKRRKVFRRRSNDHDDEPPLVPSSPRHLKDATDGPNDSGDAERQSPLPPVVDHHEAGSEAVSLAEVMRRREATRNRRGGIKFAATAQQQQQQRSQEQQLDTLPDASLSIIQAAASRFAPQTGQVVESLNKHMMAYVDSQMAKQFQRGHSANPTDHDDHDHHNASTTTTTTRTNVSRSLKDTDLPTRQPAAVGKLLEVDLGPDATLRNQQRTEAATRRLQDGQMPLDDTQDASSTSKQRRKPPKVRLGRDGKPRPPPPPRRRDRRTSDDLARDALVDAVLRETRLDMYDNPAPTTLMPSGGAGSGAGSAGGAARDSSQAADDALAEQFRQEFLDALESRQARRAPAPPPASGAKGLAGKADALAKGPRLGGSRSARAAMHRAQEEKMKKR